MDPSSGGALGQTDKEQEEEGLIMADIEEGQADIDMSSNSPVNHRHKDPLGLDSNLGKVMQTIKDIISRFQSQPLLHIDKENAQILRKYPKYLTRYSLLHLQFQDYLFRETFLVQILIFI